MLLREGPHGVVVELPRQLLVGQGVAGAAAVDLDAGLEFLARAGGHAVVRHTQTAAAALRRMRFVTRSQQAPCVDFAQQPRRIGRALPRPPRAPAPPGEAGTPPIDRALPRSHASSHDSTRSAPPVAAAVGQRQPRDGQRARRQGLGWTRTAQVGLRRRWGFEAVLSSLPTAAVAMVTASCRWTSPARASADRTLAAYSGHGLPTFILRPFLGGRVDRSQRAERSARGRFARSRPGRAGNGGTRG